MNILIVDRASAFSIWTLMNAVAEAALARGHEVVYCVMDDGSTGGAPPPPAGVRVLRIQTPPRRTLLDRVGQWVRFSRSFVGVLRSEKPDLVHTNFCVPGVAARLIARLMGVPHVISTYHEMRGSINRLYRNALGLTAWTAERRVFVSATCARSFGVTAPLVLRCGVDPADAREVVIRNGIPPIAPPGVAPRAANAAPALVSAGRLMPEKGFGAMIEAIRILRDGGFGLTVTMQGDGPARPALEAQVAAAGLGDVVTFRGWTPDHAPVMAEFAAADCVIIPSDGSHEGFGLVLAEALTLARRIVASDIPVFHEVAKGLETGLTFFRQGDPEALAAALRAALAQPLEEDAIRNRQAEARERFDIARMAALYLDLYGAAERRRSR